METPCKSTQSQKLNWNHDHISVQIRSLWNGGQRAFGYLFEIICPLQFVLLLLLSSSELCYIIIIFKIHCLRGPFNFQHQFSLRNFDLLSTSIWISITWLISRILLIPYLLKAINSNYSNSLLWYELKPNITIHYRNEHWALSVKQFFTETTLSPCGNKL